MTVIRIWPQVGPHEARHAALVDLLVELLDAHPTVEVGQPPCSAAPSMPASAVQPSEDAGTITAQLERLPEVRRGVYLLQGSADCRRRIDIRPKHSKEADYSGALKIDTATPWPS